MTIWLPRRFAILFLVFMVVVGVDSRSPSSRTQAADPEDSKLKALRKERLAALQEIASQTTKAFQSGAPSASFAQVLEANKAVGAAELDLCDTDQQRIAELEKLLAEAKESEKLAEQLEKQAKAPAGTALKAKADRLEVAIALAVATGAANDAEIARLVKELGDDEFAKREAATKRLKEIGEPALDAVTKAETSSNDAEVRRRAKDIVTTLAMKLSGEEQRFTGHASGVYSVSISADGKRLLTSSEDKTLRLWDADTGKQLRVFEGHTERIVGAALSPDGKRVLSGSSDRTVRLWDASTGKELQQYVGHTDQVLSVAFGPEGKAVSGGGDRTMILWNLETGKNVGVFTGHTNCVRMVAYSSKAKLAATSSTVDDQSIRLWNLETGKEVRKLTGHTGNNDLTLCFSPDGKRLASTGVYTDHTVRIWDVETGKELKRVDDVNAVCVAFSPDGKRIVTGGYLDKTVRVWDAETGQEVRRYEGHTGPVTSVAFFPDGKRIASASHDGTVRIWRAPR